MIIKVDATALEWRVKVLLSQDPVGIEEIHLNEQDPKKYDFHTGNKDAFGLPSRLIAKVFVYRMIFADAFGDRGYSGPAWAYANDVDFQGTSTRPKFWEEVIYKFFNKYKAVHEHSINLIREGVETGRIIIPTGMWYPFQKQYVKGKLDWPRTQMLNYPIQGFSAEIMKQVRLLAYPKLKALPKEYGALMINTVHDDIEVDVDNSPEAIYNTSIALEDSFKEVGAVMEKKFGMTFNVPMTGEVKYGMSLYEDQMKKFNRKTFHEENNAI